MGIVNKVIGGLADPIFGVIDEFVEDKDQRNKLKNALQTRMIESKDKRFSAAASIVEAEIKSGPWSRRWRPLLMYTFIALIINNFIVAPFLNALFGAGIQLEVPDQMWTILMIGLGGYVNAEAGVKAIKEHQKGKVEREKAKRGVYDNVKGDGQ